DGVGGRLHAVLGAALRVAGGERQGQGQQDNCGGTTHALAPDGGSPRLRQNRARTVWRSSDEVSAAAAGRAVSLSRRPGSACAGRPSTPGSRAGGARRRAPAAWVG